MAASTCETDPVSTTSSDRTGRAPVDPSSLDDVHGTDTGITDTGITDTGASDTGATDTVPTKRRTLIRRSRRPRRAADSGISRLGDLTRTIPIERRITQRRRTTAMLGIAVVGIAAALATALFVLPVQTYRSQSDALALRSRQLDELEAVNAELAAEVRRLRTEAGVREAAREEIGYAEPDEDRLTLMDLPPLPTQLPAGWPYDLVSRVIALRTP